MANVVINCDDLGLSLGTNKAIGILFEKELITSCSALVNFEEISSAKLIATEYDFTEKIGLHFNITEGRPISEEVKSVPRICEDGRLHGRFRSGTVKIFGGVPIAVDFLTWSDISAIKKEFNCQVDKFIDIFGLLPSHVDSHHGSHHDPILFLFICRWARERNISAIRPQFNLVTKSPFVRTVKNILNRYAKLKLTNQADFFGSLDDFLHHIGNEKSKVELMVHALPTDSSKINDIDGIDLEKKIRSLNLAGHNKCSYRDFLT